MNIRFSPRALADLEAIHDYIAADNPNAADSVIQRVLQSIAMLESFPLLGRDGRIAETRELLIPTLPYFAVYRIVDETQLTVLTVMHTARQYP